MNWIVRRVIKTVTQEQFDEYEHCDHVKVGESAYYGCEHDSFGPLDGYLCCETCRESQRKSEAEELVYCNDCGKEHPRANTVAWKWYDFYAPQGDEPIIVCDTCRLAARHQRRVAKDQADYNREFGHEVDTDDDDYDYCD